MKVTLLDTKTGRTAESSGYSTQYWDEGNGSCDCNRERYFGEDDSDGICLGCHRYIIIDAEVEDENDYECSPEELNGEYPEDLLRRHGLFPMGAEGTFAQLQQQLNKDIKDLYTLEYIEYAASILNANRTEVPE